MNEVRNQTADKLTIRLIAIILLLFNGIGAIYGGGLLIIDRTGGRIELPLHWLEHAPFADYLVPGIVLFIFNGLSSLTIAVAGAMRAEWFSRFVIAQGLVLAGWLIVQINMIQFVYFLHYVMGSIALLLILIGGYMMSKQHQK
jgi:hypothetical protein